MTGSNATFRFYSPSVMHYHYPFYLYLLTFFHLMENMSYISHLSLLFLQSFCYLCVHLCRRGVCF